MEEGMPGWGLRVEVAIALSRRKDFKHSHVKQRLRWEIKHVMFKTHQLSILEPSLASPNIQSTRSTRITTYIPTTTPKPAPHKSISQPNYRTHNIFVQQHVSLALCCSLVINTRCIAHPFPKHAKHRHHQHLLAPEYGHSRRSAEGLRVFVTAKRDGDAARWIWW